MNNANVHRACIHALYFAVFFVAHKTSDLNGIRSSGIAPRRREYKWRAPGVKNPSKNVARRVKDICFAVERLGRALRAREPPTLLISFYFSREHLQIRNESEEVRVHRGEIVAYLIEKLFSLQNAADQRTAWETTRGKIVKGNGSTEIKRARKCFIACPTHLPR